LNFPGRTVAARASFAWKLPSDIRLIQPESRNDYRLQPERTIHRDYPDRIELRDCTYDLDWQEHRMRISIRPRAIWTGTHTLLE